ncbi:MAG: FGGY-family carbohydrate kinase [Thermomicrobiales bacterium]
MGAGGDRITLVGGGSQHIAWQQAIADVTGLPVEVRGGREHAARGAAIQIGAITRGIPVADLSAAWRPPTVATVQPRSGYRSDFGSENGPNWSRNGSRRDDRRSGRSAARTLEANGIETPALDAEVLMRHLLG